MSVTDHTQPNPDRKAHIEDLGMFFSNIITSRHNQHAIIMIVGRAGTGKSWAAVSLSRSVAYRVAEKLGGTMDDYFNFKETFATISKDEVKRVMDKPKPHTILLLDDVAAKAMNARNYRDQDNIDFNSVLTTFRPNHNLVIMTTQAGFLLDKVPRSLSHYIIEMDEAHFDEGFTIGKVKQVLYNNASQRMIFPYIQAGAQKFMRHMFYAPPSELMDEYEQMRDEQLKRASEKEQIVEPPKIATKKELCAPLIPWLYEELGLSQTTIADKLKISQGWVSHILNHPKVEA